MSMIGLFELCCQQRYDRLIDLAGSNPAEAAKQIGHLQEELAQTSDRLENDRCAGEVFLALWAFLQTEHTIDLRAGEEQSKLSQLWRDSTGEFDLVVFPAEERARLLALEESMDGEAIDQFVSQFFQLDCGQAGQIAWRTLLQNLKQVGQGELLLWRLV